MDIENRGVHYGLDLTRCLMWIDDRIESHKDLHKTTIFMFNNNKGSGPIISFGIDINIFDIKPYISSSNADTLSMIYPIKLKGDAANVWIGTAGSQFTISMSESYEIGKAVIGKMWQSLSQALSSIGVSADDLPSPIKTALTSIIYESGASRLVGNLGQQLQAGNWNKLAYAIEAMDKSSSSLYGPKLQKIIDKRKAQADYIRGWLDNNIQASRPDPLNGEISKCFTDAKLLWERELAKSFNGPAPKTHEDFPQIGVCEFNKDNDKISVYSYYDNISASNVMSYPTSFKTTKEAAYEAQCKVTEIHAKIIKDCYPYMPPGVLIVQGYKDPNEQAAEGIDMLVKSGMSDSIKAIPNGQTWSGDCASRLTGIYNNISYPYIDWDSIKSTLGGIGIEWDTPGTSLHQIGMALDFAVIDSEYDAANNVSGMVIDIIKWFMTNHTKLDDEGNLVSYHDIKNVYYEENGAIQIELKNEFYPGIKGDGKTNSSAVQGTVINSNTADEIYRILRHNDFYDVKDSPYLNEEEKLQVPNELANDKSRLATAITQIFDYMLYGPRGAISVGVNTQFEYTNARLNGVAAGVDAISGAAESLGAVGLTTAVGITQKTSTASSCQNPILAAAAAAGPAKDSVMKNAADWKARLNEKMLGRIKNLTSSGKDSIKSSASAAGKQTVSTEGGIVSVIEGVSKSPAVVNGYAQTGDGYYQEGRWNGYKSKVKSPQYDAIARLFDILQSEYDKGHARDTYNVIHRSGPNKYIKFDFNDGHIMEISKNNSSYRISDYYNCTAIDIKKDINGGDSLTSKSFKWKSGSYQSFISYVS